MATTPVLGAFFEALFLHRFCSSCTPTTRHAATRGRKFIYADDMSRHSRPILHELECSLSSDMARMSHFCGQWRLKPSASKTISSVFHLHNTSATRELSVYLDGQRLQHECHETYLRVTLDPYAVLQRTLDEDCRQAEEPKQLVDEASRFHLGRQCQHFADICSGALLFSSRILRPSLVTQVRSMYS